MSDSDDTDILLLIPPELFLVDSSDSEFSNFGDHSVGRSVVNDLISHVNELDNRISEIEKKDTSTTNLNDSIGSMSSLRSSSINRDMNPASRHLGSDPSINISPSRRANRFHSLPPTPSSSSYRSYVPSVSTSRTWAPNNSSPSKAFSRSYKNLSSYNPENDGKPKANNLLSEVDSFLEGLKRDSASSRANREKELIAGTLPPSPQKKETADGVAHLQLDEVDRLLKEVEVEQKNIEARLSSHDAPEVRKIVRKPGETIGSIPDRGFGIRDSWKEVDNFIQRERNRDPVERSREPVEEPIITSRNQYKLGDNIGSIPDRGFGIREAWATSISPPKVAKPMLQSESYLNTEEAPMTRETAPILLSDSGHLPKQTPKVFVSRRKLDLDSHAQPRAPMDDVMERETVTSLDSLPSSSDQVGAIRNRRAVTQPTVDGPQQPDSGMAPKPLLSLAELWSDGEGPDVKSTGDTKLLQKYEEERCRRQHCEQLVQALQTKLLESQQKLAVAVQVDSDKDAAISKLQGAWNSLAGHWRSLEEQRHSLAKQLQDNKLSSETQLKQMHEKIERYETELSKALDLAHGYKEQSESAEHSHNLQMEQLATKAHELERRLTSATRSQAEAEEREEALRRQINEDHIKLTQLQQAMDEATKALSSQEADVAVLAEEKQALQTRLKEEKSRLDMQQQARDKMRSELEETKARERTLQSELKKCSEQLEAMKTELHDFYQAQLERVVRDKLKEFQSQLDAAESTLQRELESRERSVAQLAARQLQHVTEKHKLEVSLLEQKHTEELRLMQLQLAKATRQIKDLESRLAAYEKRSSTLAERLHGVMENQWREALNIISSPNDKKVEPDDGSFKQSKPSLGRNEKMNDTAWMLVQQQQQQQSQSQCSSRSSGEDTPFSRDGQVTHRIATPVQQQPNQSDNANELQKYIKMLLDRAPGSIDTLPDHEKVHTGGKASGSASSTSQLKPPWK